MQNNLPANEHIVVVGATNIDDVFFLDDPLPLDGKVNSRSDIKMLGGGGMNTAINMHLLNTVFGTSFKITLCTKIGKSAETMNILEEARAMNIEIIDAFSKQDTTIPHNIVIAHQAGRSIIRRAEFNHASLPLSSESERNIHSSVQNATAVFLQTKHPRIAQIAADAAHINGIPLIVDYSNTECPETLLDYADYALLPAELRFSDMQANDDALTLLKRVAQKVPYTVVSDADNPSLRMYNRNLERIPSHKVQTLDSLGAGDLRDAAFCYFMMRKDEADTALRKANIIASISCEYYGRSWVNEITARLHDFPEFQTDLMPKAIPEYRVLGI